MIDYHGATDKSNTNLDIDTEEHLADPLDKASRNEQLNVLFQEKLIRARAAPEQVQREDDSGNKYWPITECVDCGEDIPEGRLNLGKIRCIYCQEEKERRK